MAVPTNTIQTVTRVGNREDLSNVIYNISPADTPFVSAASAGGRGKASAVYTEWQTDTLNAANPNNAAVQGDDLANENRAPTTRLGNYTQIFTKVIGTSTTQDAVTAAGRPNGEHAYQKAKAGKELKRDMEARFTGNYSAIPPTATVAGQAAGLLAFLRTNTSRGAGGANPTLSGGTQGYPNAAATNGTLRTFTEALLKQVNAAAYQSGGNPSMVLMSPLLKMAAGGFAGIAQQRRDTGDKLAKIIGGADVYVSDFGELAFVPDRNIGTTRDAILLDPDMVQIMELDPMTTMPLARTGLAKRDAMYTEITLKVNNDAAHGVVADVQAV